MIQWCIGGNVARTWAGQATLLVPQSVTLADLHINRSFIETHVMTAAPDGSGRFVSVNGVRAVYSTNEWCALECDMPGSCAAHKQAKPTHVHPTATPYMWWPGPPQTIWSSSRWSPTPAPCSDQGVCLIRTGRKSATSRTMVYAFTIASQARYRARIDALTPAPSVRVAAGQLGARRHGGGNAAHQPPADLPRLPMDCGRVRDHSQGGRRR